MYALGSALVFALTVGALIDIITRDNGQIKHLPKIFWIILVVILPLIGSILWFAVGREYATPIDLGSFGDPRRRASEPQQQTRAPAPPTRSTEQELAELDREIEFYAQKARIQHLEAELDRHRDHPGTTAS